MNEQEITAAQLKKTLKALSKNQLIALVLQQVQGNIEQQAANKIMLDELKRLEDKYVRPEEAARQAAVQGAIEEAAEVPSA